MHDEGFIRQRRNLILMSLVVLAVNVAGARIERLSLLGNEITLT